MKRFTIGVTTHNEANTIHELLSSLSVIPASEIDIILYDDGSTDETKAIISQHPLAQSPNFCAHFSTTNTGSPSAGRTFVGKHAKTEYVALFDGDDFLDAEEFQSFAAIAPSGYDLILTTFMLRGKRSKSPGEEGPLLVSDESIQRIISGIGGKVYRSGLLAEFGPDKFNGRSDDTRLNMRILIGARPRIFHMPSICYYIIQESRKSSRAATLNFDEIRARLHRYAEIQAIYGVDGRYFTGFERNLRKVIGEDASLSDADRASLLAVVGDIFHVTSRPKKIDGSTVRTMLQSLRASIRWLTMYLPR